MKRKPVTQLPVVEALTASAWGYSEAAWLNLTDQERRRCRWNITKGPHYRGTP